MPLAAPGYGRFYPGENTKKSRSSGNADSNYSIVYRNEGTGSPRITFFSGHCVNDHHNQLYFATCLTCKNPQGQLVQSTAVAASFVQEVMNASRSQQQVVILDCCFSNAFADVWSAINYHSLDIASQLGGVERVILNASTSTQTCLHKGFDLSTYTRYLVEGIETKAADLNRDQSISVDELHQYISRIVETVHVLHLYY